MRFLQPFLVTIFFLAGFCYSGGAQSKESVLTKRYTPDELRQDALILKEVILSMHPAIGIYKPKDYYILLLDNFIASLNDSLTEKEFRIKIKLVLNELLCGHTEVIYSKAFYKEIKKYTWNYSPYIFIPIQNQVYVLANLNRKRDSVLRKGTVISKINDIYVDSIIRFSKQFVSSDGYNQTAKMHYVQLGFNSYLMGLFSRPDTFSVEYKLGQEYKIYRYAALKTKALPLLPIAPPADSTLVVKKRVGISYRFLDKKKKSFYLKVDKFSHAGFKRQYKKCFKACQLNECENLIIDLRNNGGGSLANSYRLLSYLIDSAATQTLQTSIKNYPLRKYTRGNLGFKFTRMMYAIIGEKVSKKDTDNYIYTIKPKTKYHYTKKIIVLINGGSFSASCLVAAYLKEHKRVSFIGEETGGTIEGCNAGVTPNYNLPNSKLRVRIPAFRVKNDVQLSITGHGVFPDHKIEYSLQDIFSRKDLELLKAKELLKITD
jgi:hypothetical protein